MKDFLHSYTMQLPQVDSNHRIHESKSCVLPLDDGAMCQFISLLPLNEPNMDRFKLANFPTCRSHYLGHSAYTLTRPPIRLSVRRENRRFLLGLGTSVKAVRMCPRRSNGIRTHIELFSLKQNILINQTLVVDTYVSSLIYLAKYIRANFVFHIPFYLLNYTPLSVLTMHTRDIALDTRGHTYRYLPYYLG